MLKFAVLLMTMILVGAAPAVANENYRRLVNFEWEPIEDAAKYDVELKQTKAGGRTFTFKVAEAAWNGKLSPGGYVMRLRALDRRGVPGEWGEPSPFNVGLETVHLTKPAEKAQLTASGEGEAPVTFEWAPVGAATNYHIVVESEDKAFRKEETLSETKVTYKIPVAKQFTWTVEASGAEGLKSEAISTAAFTHQGSKLAKPKFETPENEFVRELKWSRPENAENFDVQVSRFNPKEKKWEKVQLYENVTTEAVAFDSAWPGGQYKASVRAKGPLRPSSEVSAMSFKVRAGNRSPAAEFTHEVRKSIDRANGWYAIASYLITKVNYSSIDYDTAGFQTAYSAVGGTGRLGAGYFREDKPWGFLGILDLSGFVNSSGQNLTYTSLEMSSVWRQGGGERGELRVQMGGYYKEHPVALATLDSVSGLPVVGSYDKVTVLGPHLGGEYWYSVTPKIGFQVNAHVYYSLMKMKTPNGQDLVPTMSNQVGFLGSYRYSSRATFLAGVAQRTDKVQYKSLSGGNADTAQLEGTYLNLFAEYNF